MARGLTRAWLRAMPIVDVPAAPEGPEGYRTETVPAMALRMARARCRAVSGRTSP
jgi:hypothetical protein